MSFDAVDVSGKTGDRQRMDAAITQFKDEAFEPASLAFFEISQDPKMAALSIEAEYWLAKSLYKLGLYHSSLGMFSKVLAPRPNDQVLQELARVAVLHRAQDDQRDGRARRDREVRELRVPRAFPQRVPLPARALQLRARQGARRAGTEGRSRQELR